MWPPAILFDDSWSFVLRMVVYLALAGASALSYQRYRGTGRILNDPDVTQGLNAEQRLRLELGLLDTSPHVDATDPLHPVVVDDGGAMAAAVRKAREASRRRERGHLDDLTPAEMTRLRVRMDHIVRERWARIEAKFNALAADHDGSGWGPLVNGETGLMALLTDLALELNSGKRQPTYPPVVLQLEGPLGTLADVVRHAQRAADPTTPAAEAHQLRAGVLAFLADVFPQICANIRETEVRYAIDEDFELAREVELQNQDLPTQ
jgi:hypothetical protein